MAKYGKKAQSKVKRAMHERKRGTLKSGRSGKKVTVVEQLELPPRELEAWLKDLKGALGCGGAIEGSTLVLQGDQRKRLPALLSARGARKVVVG